MIIEKKNYKRLLHVQEEDEEVDYFNLWIQDSVRKKGFNMVVRHAIIIPYYI